MDEFSAYGSLKGKVEDLVNKDIDAKKFFETLNSRRSPVEYKDTIEDVFKYLFVFCITFSQSWIVRKLCGKKKGAKIKQKQ